MRLIYDRRRTWLSQLGQELGSAFALARSMSADESAFRRVDLGALVMLAVSLIA
jgi:hypothetical protein